MLRRFRVAHVALMTIVLCPALESRTADAQGLFRRLRERRIQSRAQQPAYQPPARPQYIPRQSPQSSLQRTQPQIPSPVTPPSEAANPTQAQPLRPAKGTGDQTSKKPPVGAKDFGGSILNQPGDSSAVKPQATDNAARKASPQRPSLGIQVLPTRAGVPGLQVAGFRADSLADEAGLKKGDVIVAVEGTATPTVADIAKQLEGRKGGDRVRARIVRGRTTTAIMIPLLGPGVANTNPSVDAANQTALAQSPIDIGIKLNDSPNFRGVIISELAADSPAAIAGLKVGDRIVSIDGRLMIDHRTFDHELARRTVGEELSLQLVRNNRLVAAEVMLADPNSLAKTDNKGPAKKKGPSGDANGSVLEGVGSMLGGLFGGQSKPKSDPSAEKDDMALGDDEPIDQVVFESEIERAIKKLDRDPPSLEALELPPGEATPIPKKAKKSKAEGQSAEKLREEIQRLEQRLKELESKQ